MFYIKQRCCISFSTLVPNSELRHEAAKGRRKALPPQIRMSGIFSFHWFYSMLLQTRSLNPQLRPQAGTVA